MGEYVVHKFEEEHFKFTELYYGFTNELDNLQINISQPFEFNLIIVLIIAADSKANH